MAKQVCLDGVLDDSKYSSTIPVIGSYIAAATLVCLLFMLIDIINGFRHKKEWLPCGLFSLNSVTLTLLSIVAKIPVDLTTSMPSALDQLSKLSGTVMICISIGVFMPSMGMNTESECSTNIIALSIFVITIVVNICMQLHTGVIFMFFVEHIIIMCCMLGLVTMLWHFSWKISSRKRSMTEHNRDLITKGKGTMLRQLELCYVYGYDSNPQLVLCKSPDCATVGILCILSSAILVQAAYRSLVLRDLRFCGGVSDYGSSMQVIVITQIFTVIVGCFATSFRCHTMFANIDMMRGLEFEVGIRQVIDHNPILRSGSEDACPSLFNTLVMIWVFFTSVLVVIPILFVYTMAKACCQNNHAENRATKEFQDLIHDGDMGLEEWIVHKSVDEMRRRMVVCKRESLEDLRKLLSRKPSQQLHTLKIKNQVNQDQSIEVSSLSIVLLFRIVAITIPSKLSGSLVHAFEETYKIIHSIENRIIDHVSLKEKMKTIFARAVWKGSEFHILFPNIFEMETGRVIQPKCDFDRALLIIQGLKNALESDFVWDEVGRIIDFINTRTYPSIEELYDCMEQLMVDMLHAYFSQVPSVIFSEITKCHAEEYDQKIRHALEFLWKFESLEGLVQWVLPLQCNISSLITPGPEGLATQSHQNDTVEECNASTSTNTNDDMIVHIE